MKLQEANDMFLKEQESRGNSVKTIKCYREQIRYFMEFAGDIDCSDVNYSLIQDYTIYLKKKVKNSNHPYSQVTGECLSDVTVQTYVRGIKAFINYCIDNKIVSGETFKKFRLPKAKEVVIDILDDDMINKILKFCDHHTNKKIGLRNKLIISLMLDCGLRINEVVTLKVNNIKLNEHILKVLGKGNKERIVPFGDYTRDLVKEYIKIAKPKDILFINEYGNPVGYAGVKKLFQKLRKYTKNKDLHPHLCRHTFATKYLINGGDTTSLKMILGHTSLKMVEHYLHLAEQYTIAKYRQFSIMDHRIH